LPALAAELGSRDDLLASASRDLLTRSVFDALVAARRWADELFGRLARRLDTEPGAGPAPVLRLTDAFSSDAVWREGLDVALDNLLIAFSKLRDSVETIARRYGVPASAIMQANNIAAPATLHPGQRLVIPRYTATRVATATAAAPRSAAPASAPAPAVNAAGNAGVHVVAAGDTLSKISHRYHKSVNEIAKANNVQPTATLNVGDRLIIPGTQAAALKASAPAAAAQPKPVAASAPPKEPEPVQSASVVAPTDPLDKEAAKLAEGNGAVPKFRWPANGRVIAGYGPTTNGQQNDGINIAVPENTPVKAAEDGTVAYAGNELKGYGNLVLVRHPNGYVTAYAHAKELLVKRGDQVKRGQVIARSGQTGNVNTPQLHFEIRKGSSPLDPTRFLNGA
jgi:murein DD-endopeptidase MepM/ murein hydrolase activator NlpD